MELIQKKIIVFSLLFNIILLFSIYILYINFHKNSVSNNSVKIIKNYEIVKNSENPNWIFDSETNIKENQFSWVFIDKKTIITVAHWVNTENSNYEIYDNFWNTYSWKLIKKDIENDYAFIKTNKKFEKYNDTKIWKDLEIWEEIYTISYDENTKNEIKKIWVIKDIKWNKIWVNIIFNSWDSWWWVYNLQNELIWIIEEVNLENNIWYFLKISDLID